MLLSCDGCALTSERKEKMGKGSPLVGVRIVATASRGSSLQRGLTERSLPGQPGGYLGAEDGPWTRGTQKSSLLKEPKCLHRVGGQANDVLLRASALEMTCASLCRDLYSTCICACHEESSHQLTHISNRRKLGKAMFAVCQACFFNACQPHSAAPSNGISRQHLSRWYSCDYCDM